LSYSHVADLGPAENGLLHILPVPEIHRQTQSEMFATAYSCDEDEIKDHGLEDPYQHRMDMEDCSLFWNPKR
jgi:hypothetical protein